MQYSTTHHAPPLALRSGLASEQTYNLFEVWGDTIDARHLASAIAIGAAISLGAYVLTRWTLHLIIDDAHMVHAYSMLGGIIGCLAGGVVSAMLFKPKRTVVEELVDEQFRQAVLADLVKQYGHIGHIEDLSPEVADELRELGLYDMFAQAHTEHREPQAPHGQPFADTNAPAAAKGG